MKKVLGALIVVALICAAGYVVALRWIGGPPRTTLVAPHADPPAPTKPAEPEQKVDPAVASLTKELNAAMTPETGFPRGSQVVSLRIEHGKAILELSSEAKGINGAGDTTESMALQTLLRVLRGCSAVNELSVVLDGKPFVGDHSGDWTDLPVAATPESPQ
ncbi:MAG: GerMN domain-containing protein [Armatimonadetes bacterium]|nr:GerMN domain-containing protein [Armatimonadota bacterium]